MAKRKNEDTTLPPVQADFEAVVKALLKTPPPPVGHPATRKQAPKKKAKK